MHIYDITNYDYIVKTGVMGKHASAGDDRLQQEVPLASFIHHTPQIVIRDVIYTFCTSIIHTSSIIRDAISTYYIPGIYIYISITQSTSYVYM